MKKKGVVPVEGVNLKLACFSRNVQVLVRSTVFAKV